jgi:hypothetical protein
MAMQTLALLLAILTAGAQSDNLLLNPHFFHSGEGWSTIWTRDPNVGQSGTVTVDGRPALHVSHAGQQDWAIQADEPISARPGEVYEIGVNAKATGAGTAECSVVVKDRNGVVLNWMLGGASISGGQDWTTLHRAFVTPPATATLVYRLEGSGPGEFWFRDAVLKRASSSKDVIAADETVEDGQIRLTLRRDGAIEFGDAGGTNHFMANPMPDMRLRRLEKTNSKTLNATYWDLANDVNRTAEFTLDGSEVEIAMSGEGSAVQWVPSPGAFATSPGNWLIVPMNEGIMFPVDDASIPDTHFSTYSGHGICMPWFGQIDPATGHGLMEIIETPDDANIMILRGEDGRLAFHPQWEGSKGMMRYPRRIRWAPIFKGGYVAMAKRYREYAKQTGLFVTLAEKRVHVPAVDRLVGAVNVWNWSERRVALCKEMHEMGFKRVLWSGGGNAEQIRQINDLGYLTSRYDIYQDVYDPQHCRPGNPTEGWPQDLVLLPNGDWMKGWVDTEVHSDGTTTLYQAGVISSKPGLERAMRKIPEELKQIPYLCRFIDTTTASPWREDYSPVHPLTRSDDRKNKMALLGFCSQTEGLVVGSETGLDASVPYLDYFEGMMSLGPYRLPDSGTFMMDYRKPTPDFLKFQVGSYYRLPLWELVYHDCVVAQWYWGDATNKAPEVWDRRDLFNILYGTAPLIMFDDAKWDSQKRRMLKTYHDVCDWTRQVGYDEMTSHEFLTPDHNVQRTKWSSGKWVIVNFGDTPYAGNGVTVMPMGFTHS